MAGYIGSKAVSVNTTSATISDDLTVGDDATIAGDLDVDGTTNLDVVDIDGAVDMSSTLTVAGDVTITSGSTLDVFNSGNAATTLTALLGADNGAGNGRTNSTTKTTVIGMPHYTNSEEAVGLIVAGSTSSSNFIEIGGGGSVINAATEVSIRTAANITTTGGTTRMTVNSAGIVTTPFQPAFLASPASQQANLAVGSAVDIAFGTEIFDNNADFASSVFTAPVTGKYQLSFQLRVDAIDSNANYYQFKIVTSNRTYANIFGFGAATYYNPGSSILADMDAGDTAKLQFVQGSGSAQSDIDTESFFSGILVA